MCFHSYFSFYYCNNTTANYLPHPDPGLPLNRGGIGEPPTRLGKTHKIPSPSGGGLAYLTQAGVDVGFLMTCRCSNNIQNNI